MYLIAALALVLALRRAFAGYPAQAGLRHLRRGEAAFLRASGDAMYPPGGPVVPSASETGIDRYVDGYLGIVPPHMRRLMRMLFFLMEHATLLFPAPPPRGRRRFSSLSGAQQVAVLEAWRHSGWFPRRLAFTSLRAVLTNGYVSDPTVLRSLGLAPFEIEPPIVEADLLYPRIGAPRSSIRHGPADLAAPGTAPPLGPESPRHADFREDPR